jgi:hypothetical protein
MFILSKVNTVYSISNVNIDAFSKSFQNVLDQDPNNAAALFELGVVYYDRCVQDKQNSPQVLATLLKVCSA